MPEFTHIGNYSDPTNAKITTDVYVVKEKVTGVMLRPEDKSVEFLIEGNSGKNIVLRYTELSEAGQYLVAKYTGLKYTKTEVDNKEEVDFIPEPKERDEAFEGAMKNIFGTPYAEQK